MNDSIIDEANDIISDNISESISVDEYIEKLNEDGNSVGLNSHEYLLNAIEYFGKRTVIENGEQKERYVFFDDPTNDGKNAVIGNTEMLNSFVETLRIISRRPDRMQNMILFVGKTATGKSELKKCIINGLNSFSKTEEGKRYTCEWNVSSLDNSSSRISYGESAVDNDEWYRSPTQVPPSGVFPQSIRNKLPVSDISLDPFSEEAYDMIKKNYTDSDEIFSNITSNSHFRIKSYTMDKYRGVGVLTAEDSGSVKERLIGRWMKSVYNSFDSNGRKNPQDFSYDGVLAQGNSGVTIVEDAIDHYDVLVSMINVSDEKQIKIDNRIPIDIDTIPIFISNPNLEKKIGSSLKHIRRRIRKHRFKYLTRIRSEIKLIHKELFGKPPEWNVTEDTLHRGGYIDNVEIAPRAIQAAAVYDVISRLGEIDENLSDEITILDKAILYDKGHVTIDGDRITDVSEFKSDNDGSQGIPVTYTRDMIFRSIDSINKQESDVLYPGYVIKKLYKNIDRASVFGDESEKRTIKRRLEYVEKYLYKHQKQDVIVSILDDKRATQSEIKAYIQNVYNWSQNGESEQPVEMKVFETTHLGMSSENYSDKSKPNQEVTNMREDKIMKPINQYIWNKRDEFDEFSSTDIPVDKIPILSDIIGTYSWEDIEDTYEDINLTEWESPPDNTETMKVKQKCINKMCEKFGYSQKSAKVVCERVVSRVRL